MEIKLQTLTADKIDEFVALGAEYFKEANWHESNIEVDTSNYEKLVREYINNPYVKIICALDNDKIVGYVIGYCQNDYTKQPIGEMYKFYVSPEYRGTPVARMLVSAIVEQYKAWGCKRAYAEAASGMQDPRNLKHFTNLWGKFGYKPIGTVVMLEL